MDIKQFKAGDIIILSRKGKNDSFFSKSQRYFTKDKWTHIAVIINPILGVPSVLSANELIVTEPLERYFNEESDIEVYRPKFYKKNKVQMIKDLAEMYKKYASTIYGFFQLLWFIIRWLEISLFGKQIFFKNNPFKKGIICSELVLIFLKDLYEKNLELSNVLQKFDNDSVHVGDIRNIITNNKKYFDLIYTRSM